MRDIRRRPDPVDLALQYSQDLSEDEVLAAFADRRAALQAELTPWRHLQEADMADTPFRVIVIGGGIGGRALGQALVAAAGVGVQIHERNRNATDWLQGYGSTSTPTAPGHCTGACRGHLPQAERVETDAGSIAGRLCR